MKSILEERCLFRTAILKNSVKNLQIQEMQHLEHKTKKSNRNKKIPLKFIAYTFGHAKGLKISTQNEFLERLKG